mgnify:CR=1 FL=1
MVTLKQDSIAVTLSLLIIIVLSGLAFSFPIEKILSHGGYPWIREYPWYLYWRVALVNLVLWLVSLILLSLDISLGKYLTLLTAIAFVVFHYGTLIASNIRGYSIKVMPLIYTVRLNKYQYETSYLDLGQVIILATIANVIDWKKLIKKKSVR